MFVEVVLNTPLRQRFTYALGQDEKASVGLRAVVPFGNREVTAYIVGITDHVDPVGYVIRPLKRFIDKAPLFGNGRSNLPVGCSDSISGEGRRSVR